ncbi:MAG: hypothetical protein MR773_01705 [Eubacterium coprostanoligenes]|nr:hypothetical protein [Eubacterium coprostanoligenes]
MKDYIIDFKRANGRTSFSNVYANSEEEAIKIFRGMGKGLFGDYATMEIIKISERKF